MTVLIIQTVLLLAIAFVIGCVLGCLLRSLFGSAQTDASEPVEIKTGSKAADKLVAKRAAAPDAPIVPKPPMPVAPTRPVSKATPKPKTPSSSKDNLKKIKGIGPQNESRLNKLGITRFAQIADWKAADEAHYGEALAFPGRIEREEWVKQAKVLAKA